ncbi:MAG: hypothetical protein H0U42_00335 [Thermoleophilaceae bacterium]|nr:hypothetical protein [Thermoleophilaceae bacterium]
MKTKGPVLLLVSLVALVLAAPAANAEQFKSEYAPKKQSRDFNGGDGGWTSSESSGGLCLIPSLTCPAITNEYVADSGFLRTSGDSLLGVISEASGTFRSPDFRYRGAEGKRPDTLEFSMDRRADVGSLIEAEGDANYQVDLVGDGRRLALIDTSPLEGADVFTGVGSDVPVSKVDKGETYHLEIKSDFVTTATVAGQFATADYDNVKLVARAKDSKNGKDGKDGRDGKNGRGGDGNGGKNKCKGKTPSKRELRRVVTQGKAKDRRVRLSGRKLKVRVANRGKSQVNCKVQIKARVKRKTKSDSARVNKGERKTLRLKTKNEAARAQLASKKRVKIKFRIKAEGRKATVKDRRKIRG